MEADGRNHHLGFGQPPERAGGTVYPAENGTSLVHRWLGLRGQALGLLLGLARQSGEIPPKRLGGKSITDILERRQE